MPVSTITGRQADILHPATRSLYQVWDTIRRGRTAPLRTELDLRAIKDVLANIAIIKMHPTPPGYSFRLAGTALRTIFGKELTGTSFLDLWSPVERTTIAGLAATVLSKHQPATVRFKGFAKDGRAEGVEMIMLPISSHTNRQETQILAAIAPLTAPYWLGVHPIVRTELISHRLIRTDPYGGHDNRPQDVFADQGRPLTAPIASESEASPRPVPHHYPSAPTSARATSGAPKTRNQPLKLHLIRGGID